MAFRHASDMDIGAELTLQIVRLVHERPDPPRSPASWSVWPEGGRLTWAEVRAVLAAAPKPLLVAPLIEPGALGMWTLDSLSAGMRTKLARGIASQVEYYTAKLEMIGLTLEDRMCFEPATPACVMRVGDFLDWAREYAIGVGISIEQSSEPGMGRIVIRPPGGGGPPLGTRVDPYAPIS